MDYTRNNSKSNRPNWRLIDSKEKRIITTSNYFKDTVLISLNNSKIILKNGSHYITGKFGKKEWFVN